MDARPADPDSALAPIELDVVVPCDARRAFDYFTRDIGRWWPLKRYSCAEENAASVAFEPREGGRLVETARDGTVHPWGTVKTWEPGRCVAFTWHPARDPSSGQWVEVVFRDHPSGARVTLTHGGWDALGERAGTAREAYRNGWPTVLGQAYRDYCVSSA